MGPADDTRAKCYRRGCQVQVDRGTTVAAAQTRAADCLLSKRLQAVETAKPSAHELLHRPSLPVRQLWAIQIERAVVDRLEKLRARVTSPASPTVNVRRVRRSCRGCQLF